MHVSRFDFWNRQRDSGVGLLGSQALRLLRLAWSGMRNPNSLSCQVEYWQCLLPRVVGDRRASLSALWKCLAQHLLHWRCSVKITGLTLAVDDIWILIIAESACPDKERVGGCVHWVLSFFEVFFFFLFVHVCFHMCGFLCVCHCLYVYVLIHKEIRGQLQVFFPRRW